MSSTVAYTDETRMSELKMVAGSFVIMIVFATFAHKGMNSLIRGVLNGIIVHTLLRIGIKSRGLYEYRILKILALEMSCIFFIREPFMFDNIYAKSKEEEVVGDALMAGGRAMIAYPIMLVGGLFLLITNA